VIRSFGNDATERLWSRHRSKELDPRIERVRLRKLAMLDAAESLNDLRVPPEIAWRRCAAIGSGSTASGSTSSGGSASPADAGPQDVQIVDYH
jgi:toxin HigB-1